MSSKAEPTLKRKEIKKQSIREGSIEKKRSGRRINENFGKRKRSLVRKSRRIPERAVLQPFLASTSRRYSGLLFLTEEPSCLVVKDIERSSRYLFHFHHSGIWESSSPRRDVGSSI
jgi:hypothetical protein